MELIKSHKELKVYQKAFDVAMIIFEVSKGFPKSETYSLTDQIRRSSRSVCANITEGFRRRKYSHAFCNCLSLAEGEAAETQNWLDFALECEYLNKELHIELYNAYESIIGMLVNMQRQPEKWKV